MINFLPTAALAAMVSAFSAQPVADQVPPAPVALIACFEGNQKACQITGYWSPQVRMLNIFSSLEECEEYRKERIHPDGWWTYSCNYVRMTRYGQWEHVIR